MIQQSHSWSSIQKKKKRNITQKYACTPVFITALFTIAKTWKQPKCPSTEGWIKKKCYSDVKKERNKVICGNKDEPRDYHTKRGRQIPYNIPYT